MANRRIFLATALLGMWKPSFGATQPAGKVFRVGLLGNSPLDTPESVATWHAFRAELQNRGWSEGRNLAYVHRFAAGVVERYTEHARELIEANVDVIVTTTGSAAAAARRATSTIPIVFASVPDPVEQGLVASLAHPGGNLTGLTTLGLELAGKRRTRSSSMRAASCRTRWRSKRSIAGWLCSWTESFVARSQPTCRSNSRRSSSSRST